MKQNIFGIIGLVQDSDGDMTLHLERNYDDRWTAPTKRKYEAFAKRIDKIGVKTKAFEVYAWCDISGFDYWVRRQNEPNYIQISVLLKKEKLTAREIESLCRALSVAKTDAEGIAIDASEYVEAIYLKERA